MTYALLSIDEVEGNMTSVDDTNLREKVFCVLGDLLYGSVHNYTPVHTQTFTNPQFLSALTLKLRTYDRLQKIFVAFKDGRVGLWFKLTTDDC